MSKATLKDLQDQMGEILEARTTEEHSPSQAIRGEIKIEIREKPTTEDILLMEEYSRGVCQGN